MGFLSAVNIIKTKNKCLTATFPGTLQLCLSWHQVIKKLALLATHSQHCSSASFEYKQFQPSHMMKTEKMYIPRVPKFWYLPLFAEIQQAPELAEWWGVTDYPLFWECLEFPYSTAIKHYIIIKSNLHTTSFFFLKAERTR